jgi:hypothetical protein
MEARVGTMTKSQIRKHAERAMGKWLLELGMQHWLLSFNDKKLSHPDPEKVTYAEMKSSWEYKTITVDVDIEALHKSGESADFIEFTLLHELLHTRVAVGFDLARKVFDQHCEFLEERAVADLELSPLVRNMIGKF